MWGRTSVDLRSTAKQLEICLSRCGKLAYYYGEALCDGAAELENDVAKREF